MSEDTSILYVDDERANRIVFEQSFGARFKVRCVSSGAEALEVLRAGSVAVVITDQRMPEMSGHELLQRVRALHPEIVRVVITAYGDVDAILAAVNEGLVSRYIIKPWDRGELQQVLTWAVEAFKLGRESAALQLRLLQTERLVTLGSMAAAVLHDLNQPLTSLLYNAERALDLSAVAPVLQSLGGKAQLSPKERTAVADLAVELPDLARDLLGKLHTMQGILEDMKRWVGAQREASKDLQAVDPLPVVKHAMTVCRDTAVRAKARIVYEGPPSLPRLRIGKTELTQVLINVIANATQALLDGGRSGGRVVVSTLEAPGWLTFAVADNGVGMPPEVLQKVGTPFFSTRPEGTGLGVAQCQRLVGRAGGRFAIESERGRGTTVTFSLPVIEKSE